MKTIPANQLAFVKSDNSLPTVEVDTGSIPESMDDFDAILAAHLAIYAASNSLTRATLYYYYSSSMNFHESTSSVFIGLAGPENILQVILNAFKRKSGIRARFSDYISPYTATPMIHIENGILYRAEDPATWYFSDSIVAKTPAPSQYHDDEKSDTFASAASEVNNKSEEFQTESPTRFRSARSDATVGSIKRTIEEIFGLPEGSVVLCNPDGSAIKAVAKISTLRKRWEL